MCESPYVCVYQPFAPCVCLMSPKSQEHDTGAVSHMCTLTSHNNTTGVAHKKAQTRENTAE